MLKDEDTYYLMLGLAENQTRENLERDKVAMALYAATFVCYVLFEIGVQVARLTKPRERA